MTPEQERAYEIGIEALKSYETPQYGDLRLNAARASAKVVMALGGGGLIIVERDDLDVALPYAARDQDGAESPATARLRAVLSGTAPQPSGTLQDSQTSGDGTRGCLGLPNGSTGLSEPQPWKGNAVVLVDGQEIPVRANLTIQPSAWSVDAHLDPDAELYLPLGSCVVRLPDGREGSAYVTSVQNGVCGSLSGVGPPPTAKPLIDARAEEAEDALEAAQQALSRVVRYARALNESNPVTADRIAEAVLGPGDYAEGAALAALTEETPMAVRDEELETLRRAHKTQRDQIRAYVTAHQEDTARWSQDLEAARASIARVREVHDVHSCERDGHIHRSTPNPCVNDGFCSCGRRAPCPTLAALDSPEET